MLPILSHDAQFGLPYRVSEAIACARATVLVSPDHDENQAVVAGTHYEHLSTLQVAPLTKALGALCDDNDRVNTLKENALRCDAVLESDLVRLNFSELIAQWTGAPSPHETQVHERSGHKRSLAARHGG